jgi:flagellar hook-basal body complex protein FliE
MAINFTGVVRAYEKIAIQDSIPGSGAAPSKDGVGFSGVLRGATKGAVSSQHEGETQRLQAATGTADINDVVMTVGRAESTLKTVVSLRDKVIHAYQEVLRTPV